jgi:hypothetical protein
MTTSHSDPIQFEGVKTGLRQSKDGYLLSLAVHPDDLPDDLMRDFVGSRYMVVMVRLNDEEKPYERKKHNPDVASAGMLCRDKQFWAFVDFEFGEVISSEDECAEWMKDCLGIDSRSELKTDELAQKKFSHLKKEYEVWKKS